MKHSIERARNDEGSAFVISILVLFVLTVLGLALMLTTTTEKDIAINYRWGEQAFFNADAALEYGKNVLAAYAQVNTDFRAILPAARADATVADNTQPRNVGLPPDANCDPATPGCRDYQYYIDQCPPGGGGPCTRIFIGKVLERLDTTKAMWDFRAPAGTPGDLDNDGNPDIEGTYTLWVRRPVVGTRDYGSMPDEEDRIILTAEGTAPNAAGAGAGRPTSLRRLEMSIRLPTAGSRGTEYNDVSNRNDSSAVGGSYSGGGGVSAGGGYTSN
jgi:hypothetical protein